MSMPSSFCCNTGAWEEGSIFIGWYGSKKPDKTESREACRAQNGTLLEETTAGGRRLWNAVSQFRRKNAKFLGNNTLLLYTHRQKNFPGTYLALCTRRVECKSHCFYAPPPPPCEPVIAKQCYRPTISKSTL